MLCAFSEPVKVMVYNLETALLVKLVCVYAARALNSATRPLRKYAAKTAIPIRLETAPKVKIALYPSAGISGPPTRPVVMKQQPIDIELAADIAGRHRGATISW